MYSRWELWCLASLFKDQLNGHHQRCARFNGQIYCRIQLPSVRYRTSRSGGTQTPAWETILCRVLHKRYHPADAHSEGEEETHSLGSVFLLVRSHIFPDARKLNFVRDGADGSSTLLVEVYQNHRFKKQAELVGTLNSTIEVITGKSNDGGMNKLCRGCSVDPVSTTSIRRTSSQGYLRWIRSCRFYNQVWVYCPTIRGYECKRT